MGVCEGEGKMGTARVVYRSATSVWQKRLTLYNLNYGHNYIMNVNDTQGGTQDKLQEQIFDMIKDNPQISTSEMATKLGVGVRTVKRRIKQMTNIVYVGSGYSGHWEIK